MSTIGTLTVQLLVHGDALQVDVQQLALDRLILPVHDHGLGAFAAIDREIENRVVSGLGMQNARDLPRIERDRQRVLAGAVDDAGNLAAHAHAAGLILVARGARLRFQNVVFIVAVAINFDSYKNNLLTDVSS